MLPRSRPVEPYCRKGVARRTSSDETRYHRSHAGRMPTAVRLVFQEKAFSTELRQVVTEVVGTPADFIRLSEDSSSASPRRRRRSRL